MPRSRGWWRDGHHANWAPAEKTNLKARGVQVTQRAIVRSKYNWHAPSPQNNQAKRTLSVAVARELRGTRVSATMCGGKGMETLGVEKKGGQTAIQLETPVTCGRTPEERSIPFHFRTTPDNMDQGLDRRRRNLLGTVTASRTECGAARKTLARKHI